MEKITGKTKNIRELLDQQRFEIDFYQREYQWQTKQVQELLDDLTEKFLDSHKSGNDRSDVESYGRYFLGSIIISEKDPKRFIIDGQQRLTSLTLLLINIHRQLEDEGQRAQISRLIVYKRFDQDSFNLDIPERKRCMEALLKGETLDSPNLSESEVNILDRFQYIEDHFPKELEGEVLPYFADWLIERVYLVEITASSDSDAYTIFETMNDRGLSLAPIDMLKGYLLAQIGDENLRKDANLAWRSQVEDLQKLGKEEDADAVKAWLRSQYAKTARQRKSQATPGDFELIGTEFHRWVHDHKNDLGLARGADFAAFIEKDFEFYGRWYKRIREAANDLREGLEAIHYNAQNNFTLQYPVLLAPLQRSDSDEQIHQKLQVVAGYLDILIARRIWNAKDTGYSTMNYAMYQLVRAIRHKSIEELTNLLIKRLESEEGFTANQYFRLHRRNQSKMRYLLARMTDYLEVNSGRASRYAEYRTPKSHEIEHIWANHPSRHLDEFEHPNDFRDHRDRIGGLLLLPKKFNASYSDKPYAEKLEHYYGQNLLAQSLHERAYQNNPGFLQFLNRSGLEFRPHPEFRKADLEARQQLYLQLAEQIWDPERLRPGTDGAPEG